MDADTLLEEKQQKTVASRIRGMNLSSEYYYGRVAQQTTVSWSEALDLPSE